MVATESLLEAVSPFKVETDGPLTPQTFSILSPIAQALLDKENVTLPTALYDFCHALFIAHVYSVKLGSTDKTQESMGDYSYTKGGKVGDSSYWIQAQSIIKTYRDASMRAKISSGVERCDAEMTEVKLSQSPIVLMEDRTEFE